MQSLLKSLSVANTLLLGGLSMIITHASAAGKPAHAWSVVETAKDNGHRLSAVPAPTKVAASAENIIVCDPSKTFQEIIGFGGALTESSAWVLAQLPQEQRMEILRRYYDPKEGIGYTLARTHINSCDFSLNIWSLTPTPGDYDLHDFTLDPMRRWLMPLIHDTRKVAGADRFKLMASPWSPPAWMKTNNRMDDGGSLRNEYRPAWANVYVKFVKAMAEEEKIPIWALSVQNEVDAHQTWESCKYSPEQERDFVRDFLGPALHGAGLADVKLLTLDHNRDLIEKYADVQLGDSATAKYIWGMGLHWYVSDDYASSARVHEKFPDKHILFTEGCVEGAPGNMGKWENGERYVRNIIGDFRNYVCGFIDWNIVLDQRGGPNHVGNFCDAPVIVDTNTKQVTYGPSFYYLAHFSKFVQPGARRIHSEGGPQGIQSIAFSNPDGTLAIVVVNPTEQAADFALGVAGESVACKIPARAIQTYLEASH
jgi:glucosylceramidase